MGNQTSRTVETTSSTTHIEDDPCLDNIRHWHDSNNKRQYPLPVVESEANHIKTRKQSSPAAVLSSNNNNFRKPFSRFFRANKSLPRNNSCIDATITTTTSLSIHPNTQATPTPTINNIILDNKIINTGYNITPNTTNSTNTTTTSATSSFSQPHYIHPLAPPSIISIERHNSIDSTSKKYNKRDSLKLLMQQIQLNFKIKGNRKYHQVSGSNYLLPCDDEEIDRLHLQHFMVRFAIQG